jgi:hypothetical protein
MAEARYFQVERLEYSSIANGAGKPTEISFIFYIVPDGDTEAIFTVKVVFPYLLLSRLRNYASGGTSPSEMDKQRLLRHAFRQLETQLKSSDLNNHNNVILDYRHAASFVMELPKQCDYLESLRLNLFCCADAANPRLTSPDICENCMLPEPILRCDNLRIQKVDDAGDTDNECRIIPSCYCLKGLLLPSDLTECRKSCSGFVPYKFYIA